MKPLLIFTLITFAQPATADWYFEASLEGGAEFWTYTNENGDVTLKASQISHPPPLIPSEKKVTVMLLGRYHKDKPASLNGWQRVFGEAIVTKFLAAPLANACFDGLRCRTNEGHKGQAWAERTTLQRSLSAHCCRWS